MAYQVGIDLGSTSTVAAVCRPDGSAQVVPLEGPAGAVPSVVYLGADGDLLLGGSAERRALSDPGRVVRELVRRVGDGTPLLVGREPVAAADLAARFLARIADDVARREGGVASRVAVTYPGSWGPHRVSALRAALAEHGLGSAVLVPEPVAAARATVAQVPPGAAVGIHDLGGGRFEAAVVRRTPAGFELAAVEERDGVGGADLDEVVFGHVRTALGAAWQALDPTDPDVLAAVADLRRECTAAKEALSRDTEVLVPVALPGVRRQVRLGRAEFEEMIRPCVEETVEAMGRAVDAASTSPADLGALVLVGGSAAIPLVPQLLGEAFGRDVTVAPDTVGAVAVGAALLAHGPDAEPARPRGQGGLRLAVPVGAAPRAGAVAEHARCEQRAGAAPASGPGTLPLVVGGAAALASGDSAASSPAAGPSSGTEVLPVARPPKQARPFTAAPAANSSRPRRIALLGSAAALAVAVLGGVVAFGVGRIGAGAEAGAVTPASVVDGGAASTSVPAPPAPTAAPEPPVRSGSAGPGRRARQAVPPPPPASSVTPSPPPPTQEPPAGEEQETGTPQPTADPDTGGAGGNDGGGGNGAGEDGAGGNGAGDDGAGGGGAGSDGAGSGGAGSGGAGSDGAGSDGAGGGSAQAAGPAAASAAPAAAAPAGAAPEAGAEPAR